MENWYHFRKGPVSLELSVVPITQKLQSLDFRTLQTGKDRKIIKRKMDLKLTTLLLVISQLCPGCLFEDCQPITVRMCQGKRKHI